VTGTLSKIWDGEISLCGGEGKDAKAGEGEGRKAGMIKTRISVPKQAIM